MDWGTPISLIIVAIVNGYIAWLLQRNRIDAITTLNAIKDTQTNVKLIEIATNSMKDALVKATGEAARAEGQEEGRLKEVERSSTEGSV